MMEEINFVTESALTKHNFHQRIFFTILTNFNEISCSPTPFSQIFPFEFLPHAKPTPVFHLIAKNWHQITTVDDGWSKASRIRVRSPFVDLSLLLFLFLFFLPGFRGEFLNLGSRMRLSMVSWSCERMDVLRFDGWQCKIRRRVTEERSNPWV